MKKVLVLLLLAALACSCGTSRRVYAVNSEDEEEVNLGYQRVRKRDNTGAVSSVDVHQGSGYATIYDYLKGRVAGVEVNGSSISIRGDRSLNLTNEPLIIVDGVEVDDISDLSPDDVERVEVLKDGGSTALYGSRGANGVLIITTRRSSE